MTVNSVHTNPASIQALQALRRTEDELAVTLRRVATGRRVDRPADDPATWVVAQGIRSDIGAWGAIKQGLDYSRGATAVAVAASKRIHDDLMEMKTVVLGALNGDLSQAAARERLRKMSEGIDRMAGQASYNKINLLTGGPAMVLRAGPHGGTIEVKAGDATVAGLGLAALDLDHAALESLDRAMSRMGDISARLGSDDNRIAVQEEFAQAMIEVHTEGLGALVDADLAEEAARLSMLRVRKQLGFQMLAIANQTPAIVLRLFERA